MKPLKYNVTFFADRSCLFSRKDAEKRRAFFPQLNGLLRHDGAGIVTEQVTEQVLTLLSITDEMGRSTAELMKLVGIKHRPTFLYNYLQPALDIGLIAMTIPDKPTSSKQRYILTELGKQLKIDQ